MFWNFFSIITQFYFIKLFELLLDMFMTRFLLYGSAFDVFIYSL